MPVKAVLTRVFRIWLRGLKWLCITIGAAILIGSIIVGIVGGFSARYVFSNRYNLPDVQSFVNFDVPQIGIIYDSKDRPIINLAKEYRLVITPEEITVPIREAFLSAEDKSFYVHNGVDWLAVGRAAERNLFHSVKISLRNKRPRMVIQQGASTITDQLIGLYYKDHLNLSFRKLEESWWGLLPGKYLKKMEEWRLSIWLEEELVKPEHFGSKRRVKNEVLARLLSYVYFRKVYGVKAASLYYFGKDVSQLNYGEAALLAGIIKNPGLYAPTPNPSNNLSVLRQLNRRNAVLDLMAKNSYLTQLEADKFKETELPAPEDRRSATDAPSVVGDVLSELKSTGVNVDKLFDGKIRVHSVSNLDIQTIANQALENGLRAFEERHPNSKGVIQGSVVALRNSDAAILAEVGGRKIYNDKMIRYADFNRVRHSWRQPGSAFKPFVYLSAILADWQLDDKVRDTPIAVPMGSGKPAHIIQNYDEKYKGTISMRKALAESRNAATVWLLEKIGGIEKVAETAKLLGIKTSLCARDEYGDCIVDDNGKETYYVTTALGASEVNLLELANAYRAIASGILAKPYVINEVSDNYGNIIFKASPETSSVPFYEDQLASIQEGLRGIVRLPGGTAYSLTLENFPVPVMGKTGTTNDFRDALFVGSTYGPDGITVAVRIGYDNNRELGNSETGARAALPVFKEIMREVYERGIAGLFPEFPQYIEENINNYILNPQ